MKHVISVFSLLIIGLLISCSKDVTHASYAGSTPKETLRYELLGTLHSDGLSYCLAQLPDSADFDTMFALTTRYVDSAGVAIGLISRPMDSESKAFIKSMIDTLTMDSTTLMGILSSAGYNNLIQAMSNIVQDIKAGYLDDLKEIESNVLNSNYKEEEQNILLSAVSIGLSSYDYSTGKLGKTTSVIGVVAFCDVLGGLAGGLLGDDWDWGNVGTGALIASMAALAPYIFG